VTNFMDALNGTDELKVTLNLTNLENILGNFKQTLISSVELSFPVFYSLVSQTFRTVCAKIFVLKITREYFLNFFKNFSLNNEGVSYTIMLLYMVKNE